MTLFTGQKQIEYYFQLMYNNFESFSYIKVKINRTMSIILEEPNMSDEIKEQEIVNLKELLEEGNTVIVCDANVYLHIYALAQGYCDFAIECMKLVQSYLIVPSMVELEFNKHYKKCYKDMTHKLKNARNQCEKPLNSARSSILAACMNLKKMQFPDVDDLLSHLDQKIEEQIEIVDDFFVDREDILSLVAEKWKNDDFVALLMEELKENNQILDEFTQLELYRLCENGKKRYGKQIPPGYEDDDKDGIRKYGDFIWWFQILQYAKKEKSNIVLVTDDVKSDWWDKKEDGNIVFKKELFDEFHKTKQEIYPFTSNDFYEKISQDYCIDKPDIIQYALQMTDEDYCERISDDVFYAIETILTYNGTDYIEEDTAHIGDLGIEEYEIEEWSFIEGEQVDREDDEVVYVLRYDVQLSGDSHSYSGRDEDTREIIESLPSHHVFKGTIEVQVIRNADIQLDFESESSFENAEIIEGTLEETEYEPYVDEWEEFDDDNYSMEMEVDGETFTVNSKKDAYTTCPKCGKPLSMLNDMGGVCQKCYQEYDEF